MGTLIVLRPKWNSLAQGHSQVCARTPTEIRERQTGTLLAPSYVVLSMIKFGGFNLLKFYFFQMPHLLSLLQSLWWELAKNLCSLCFGCK